MAIYCFCHCFLYPRTECIMKYGAVRKFYRNRNNEIESITSCFDKIRKFQANEDLHQRNVSKFESEF